MRPALAMHYPNLRRTRSGKELLDVLDFVGTNNTVYKFWLSYLQLVVVISGADNKVKGGVTLMHCRLNESHLRDIFIKHFCHQQGLTHLEIVEVVFLMLDRPEDSSGLCERS